MIVSFHPCITADHQVIPGSRDLDDSDQALIDEADAIILPQGCSRDLYTRCSRSSAKIFPNYNARFNYPGKTGQILMFKETGTPHPETIVWGSAMEMKTACRNSWPHGLPFLVKEGKRHEGEGIFLIEDRKTFEYALNHLSHEGEEAPNAFISQEIIRSEGNVLRVVVIGRKILSYWKRPLKIGQIVTTAGSGAKIDKTWRKDLQEDGCLQVKKLSDAMNINLAGFDLVFQLDEKEPRPFFLEINYFFGRRGIGGLIRYYKFLFKAVCDWLTEEGLDRDSLALI